MLKKYRYVEYLDDGVISCQCLSCGKYWTSTSTPDYAGWKYCPYCGLQWEGKHECREHGYKIYDAHNKMTEEQQKTQSRKRHEDERNWEIQSRTLNEDGEVIRDWEYYHDWEHDYPTELYKDESTLRATRFAAHNLKRVRNLNKNHSKDEFGWTNEYRLVLLKPAMRTDQWHDYNKKEIVRVLT